MAVIKRHPKPIAHMPMDRYSVSFLNCCILSSMLQFRCVVLGSWFEVRRVPIPRNWYLFEAVSPIPSPDVGPLNQMIRMSRMNWWCFDCYCYHRRDTNPTDCALHCCSSFIGCSCYYSHCYFCSCCCHSLRVGTNNCCLDGNSLFANWVRACCTWTWCKVSSRMTIVSRLFSST